MALTKDYKTMVLQDIADNPEVAKTTYSEAVHALLEGEPDVGLSLLRDVVHACISFKTLSEQTGIPEKSLHRMLSGRGNPRTDNLSHILKAVKDTLHVNLITC